MAINLIEVLKNNPVIPVAVFGSTDHALKVSELLLENRMSVLEVTLRTDAAFDCIERVSRTFPEMTVGAGSVLSSDSLSKARDKGARFGVAPCLDPEVMERAASLCIPFIPGISTPSELNQALKKCSIIKLFPASHLGGVEYIKALAAPFKMRELYLVPTGGVNDKNYREYLKADRVIACGMTYLVESALMDKGDFETIRGRIQTVAAGLHS